MPITEFGESAVITGERRPTLDCQARTESAETVGHAMSDRGGFATPGRVRRGRKRIAGPRSTVDERRAEGPRPPGVSVPGPERTIRHRMS